MEYLSIYACFDTATERNKFCDERIKPFAGADKPIFSISLENESCSTQELLEVKVLLKKALPFIKDNDKLINQIKAKLKD